MFILCKLHTLAPSPRRMVGSRFHCTWPRRDRRGLRSCSHLHRPAFLPIHPRRLRTSESRLRSRSLDILRILWSRFRRGKSDGRGASVARCARWRDTPRMERCGREHHPAACQQTSGTRHRAGQSTAVLLAGIASRIQVDRCSCLFHLRHPTCYRQPSPRTPHPIHCRRSDPI